MWAILWSVFLQLTAELKKFFTMTDRSCKSNQETVPVNLTTIAATVISVTILHAQQEGVCVR